MGGMTPSSPILPILPILAANHPHSVFTIRDNCPAPSAYNRWRMGEVSYLWAFLGGLASFLSPCVLPLVPGYVALISGASLEELKDGADQKVQARAFLH